MIEIICKTVSTSYIIHSSNIVKLTVVRYLLPHFPCSLVKTWRLRYPQCISVLQTPSSVGDSGVLC